MAGLSASPTIELTPEYIAADSSPPGFRTFIAFIVLETITIVAYFASRWIKQPDGYRSMPFLMVGGYICCVGIAIESLLVCVIGGGGHHILVVPEYLLIRRFKLAKAIEWTYLPACTFPKIAVLTLYMKIFAQHRRRLRYAGYATGTVIILLLIYGLISPGLSCRPFAYNWDKSIKGGKCFNVLDSYRWVSFPNIITDLILMGLCMPAIYNIQLPPVTKISLFATFALGSVGIITSIIRFVEFFTTDIFADYTYNGITSIVWSTVEPGVYFMAAALLTMRPLFRRVFQDIPVLPYIEKLTTSWTSRKSSKGSKDSSGIHKDERIELEYSESTKGLSTVSTDRDGFTRLDDPSVEDVERGKVEHARTSDDPWLTNALR